MVKDSKGKTPYTVAEYIDEFNQQFRYKQVKIQGELQEVRISKNLWVFFQLKDPENESVLRCFAVKSRLGSVPIDDGMKVIVSGYAKLHEKYGFSITVEHIELAGEGALAKAQKELRDRLEKEGIFEESRKRAIPEIPQRIALIASRESAAYSDFLTILGARRRGIVISVRHTAVQGASAVPELVQAIDQVSRRADQFDAVVMTRGGGSIEDLQAFNTEAVVRAVFSCKIPMICAIGHERDETLSELAADLRASTPSNAAELVSKTTSELLSQLHEYSTAIERALGEGLAEKGRSIERASASLNRVIERQRLRRQSLEGALQSNLRSLREDIHHKAVQSLRHQQRLQSIMQQRFRNKQQQLAAISRLLESGSPTRALQRGYSIIRNKEGAILSSVQSVRAGETLYSQMRDGTIESTALEKKEQRPLPLDTP